MKCEHSAVGFVETRVLKAFFCANTMYINERDTVDYSGVNKVAVIRNMLQLMER